MVIYFSSDSNLFFASDLRRRAGNPRQRTSDSVRNIWTSHQRPLLSDVGFPKVKPAEPLQACCVAVTFGYRAFPFSLSFGVFCFHHTLCSITLLIYLCALCLFFRPI